MFNGTVLHALREQANMSLVELADQIGSHITCDELNDIEQGRAQPDCEAAARIADVFEVPAARFLLSRDDIPIPRHVLRGVIDALFVGDSRWAMGHLQGALAVAGYEIRPLMTLLSDRGKPSNGARCCGGDCGRGAGPAKVTDDAKPCDCCGAMLPGLATRCPLCETEAAAEGKGAADE